MIAEHFPSRSYRTRQLLCFPFSCIPSCYKWVWKIWLLKMKSLGKNVREVTSKQQQWQSRIQLCWFCDCGTKQYAKAATHSGTGAHIKRLLVLVPYEIWRFCACVSACVVFNFTSSESQRWLSSCVHVFMCIQTLELAPMNIEQHRTDSDRTHIQSLRVRVLSTSLSTFVWVFTQCGIIVHKWYRAEAEKRTEETEN